ncbi:MULTISPECIES: sn-glycerol-3-phosphate ABC transporter ATP-binding protein UgpC [unclassified Mesorhizobium]|uniref:ABC transporter ATP-binding protein n=1 Tax=unclassified Mesorhizobium TaxID=325217 RepID=UPI000FCA3E25|nr:MULTISPECIES: sn-glycerol-3-phosphate ABC transporter ATP-binding protein UgpC [unclassified Mesorhizobium]RUW99098.1 sn-glycerol-3-phosphate ABC transporter ATP-binding protein UgpC [Mesorhizobium sp. M8A.F.Ca.ET.023.01.1.1]RUW99707.1 sn-glycerol-3-phosphate ABC transporter ATP-binding protein UgpC [Mesorhizobium sp. M8A.F.Ca.ET.059.01.1.1]RWC74674.1 MAG: sn-glycerol-3-phosphate ABC transporter ATP-binding protein UgpC [Mesorhizobium sp.]RUW48260.1 sn-glycerol-3-phosphate ABC transporter AT
MSAIVCSHVDKAYGATTVIRDLNLAIEEHEFVVFLGPSGCGKSTLLRMLAGLEDISGGEVSIGGKVVNDLDPGDRGIAMVFQNYALYPHMTIFDNIAFGLRRQKVPAPEIRKRVEAVSRTLGLDPYLGRKPAELSGGQQQRVAIARAMIKTPKVFLFDEPLSNLDAKLRNHMRVEIARLHQSLKTTTVYVTHDQLEAMTLADRIVLLKDGVIEQVGSPAEIYGRPGNMFVAGFIGTPNMNFIEVTVGRAANGWTLTGAGTVLSLDGAGFHLQPGDRAVLGIRPPDLKTGSDGAAGILQGTADLIEFHGNDALVTFGSGGKEISALVPARECPVLHAPVRYTFEEESIHLFDATSGASLRKQ